MTECYRALFAIADNLDLTARSTLQHQELAHRVGATLTEGHVIFTGAAFIGMAFQCHAGTRMLGQIGGMGADDVAELILDIALVKIKVDNAF